MINQRRLHEMFEYVHTTGHLIHRYTVQGGKRAGQIAGSPHNCGYLQICIDRKKYLIHRLIFVYVYGRWPTQIDHVNGVRSDNRIENLRECTYTQNHGNKGLNRNNTSGFKGVCYCRKDRAWIADLAGSRLGNFRTKELAAAAYDRAAILYYGDFALTNKSLGLL